MDAPRWDGMLDSVERESADEIATYFDRLWPLLRSLTGEGVRETHDILSELIPLDRSEIPTGTRVHDWTVPKEWVVREAYVLTPAGEKILDVAENNLHLLGYSAPFRGRVSRRELDEHLISLPEQRDAIPYATSYYAPRWGFCISQAMRDALEEGAYEVVVDTELIEGSLTLSDLVLSGETDEEVLISTYTCHPSMANDDLSGPLVAAFLYRRLAALPKRRLSYRFVFLPETIGSIAYLSRLGEHLRQHVAAGYVMSCIGDDAPFTFKRSRRGDTLADRAAIHALRHFSGDDLRVLDFYPSGSDERQYCSPGYDFPVGVVARSIFGRFPQYHTSLDNRDFISFSALRGSVDACFAICRLLDRNLTYRNLLPYGELQLGKRGLYPSVGAQRSLPEQIEAIAWLLNLADGTRDLLSISERSGIDFWLLDEVAQTLRAKEVLAIEPPVGERS